MIESFEDEPKKGCLKECKICLGEHDEEIHAATVSVHAWLRARVTRYLDVEVEAEQCVA